MKPWFSCIVFLWMMSCPLVNASVILRDGDHEFPLAGRLEVMEDQQGSLTVADVLTPDIQSRFVPSPRAVPSFGFSRSAYWARVEVRRDTSSPLPWYLELSYAPMQWIDVHVVSDGRVIQSWRGGSGIAFRDRPVPLPTHVFPLQLPPQESVMVYVRIHGESSKSMPLRLLDADALRNAALSRASSLWAYAGLMLGLAAYHAMIFLRTREKVFLWHLLFMPSILLLILTLNGVSPQVLWPHLAESGLRIIPLAISVSMALGGLFFIEYMQLRGVRTLAMTLAVAGLCLQCFVAVAGLFVDYHVAILSALAAAGIYCAYGVVFSLFLALSGNVPAQRYFVSWLPLLLGVIVQSLAAADVLPLNVFTVNVTLVGSALQSLLLSLALADRMRTMKDENEAALRQMMQQEKMASLGMLSAGVAHEINNPNSFIRVGIGNLSAKVEDLKSFIEESLDEDAGEVREIFREKFASIESQAGIVLEGTQRIDTIVKGMRAGSRADGDQATLFNPLAALRATVDLVQPTWKTVAQFDASGLQAEADVMGFASQLNQVFTNFMVNACHAIEDRQRLRPGHERGQVTLTSRLEGGELVIAIADNGCGMSEAVQQRLFQPFFTTKSGERGTGLGMGICKKIVEGHGGRIRVESREGAGTTMSIVLPVHVPG